jgi:O-antigen/teichoic acid export membrane protein
LVLSKATTCSRAASIRARISGHHTSEEQHLSIERQAAVGLKWNTAARITGQAISWAVTLIVIRLLTPEDYGLLAMSMVIITMIAGFAEFGLGGSLIQAETVNRAELARLGGAVVALNVGCGLLVVAGADVYADLLGQPRLAPLIRVLALQFLLNAIEVVPQSIAYREMHFKRLAGIDLAVTLVGSAVTLALAWLGAGVWALAFGTLAGGLLRMILLVSLSTFVWPSFRFGGIGRHVRFGGAMTAGRMLWQFTYQADVLIAGRFLTSLSVGLYSVALNLATLPMNKAMGIVNQVAFSAVARLQEDLPRMRERLLEALRLLALAAISTLWGIAAVAPEFIDVVLGERWHPAIFALQIVSIFTPVRMLAAVFSTALAGIGRADLDLRNMVINAVVLPAGFLIGVQWGLDGLAASWALGVPIASALNFPRTLAALGIGSWQLWAAVRVPFAAGVIMLALVTGLRAALVDLGEFARLLVLICAGAAGYLGTVHLLDRGIWIDVRRLAVAVRG